jgi:hypothetical protein
MSSETLYTRRQFASILAGVAVLALAGCSKENIGDNANSANTGQPKQVEQAGPGISLQDLLETVKNGKSLDVSNFDLSNDRLVEAEHSFKSINWTGLDHTYEKELNTPIVVQYKELRDAKDQILFFVCEQTTVDHIVSLIDSDESCANRNRMGTSVSKGNLRSTIGSGFYIATNDRNKNEVITLTYYVKAPNNPAYGSPGGSGGDYNSYNNTAIDEGGLYFIVPHPGLSTLSAFDAERIDDMQVNCNAVLNSLHFKN